jgi:glycosyltransferase involved in cell wall biosynthesis
MDKDSNRDQQSTRWLPDSTASGVAHQIAVALLTGGGDRPYAFGLATELISKGAALDLIGSDELDCAEFHSNALVNFLNLRGNQRSDVTFLRKVLRVSTYYARLIRYVATSKPKILHILWNNKFEFFDRTLLMVYYKLLGKRIVITVHNVNAAKRDSKDTRSNRITLRVQYRLAEHIFVHTEKMKLELIEEFGVKGARITVIPFGINNAVPNTGLTSRDAKRHLGIREEEKAILFFGNITPYKGLEYLVDAFLQLAARHPEYRLIIAGQPRREAQDYFEQVQKTINHDVNRDRVIQRTEHVPDEEVDVVAPLN